MPNDPNSKVVSATTFKIIKILIDKYPKDYKECLDIHRGTTINYISRSRASLRKRHELEFQKLYSKEISNFGIISRYDRRVSNLKKLKKLLETAEPTSRLGISIK
jgi:hypothetical protein